MSACEPLSFKERGERAIRRRELARERKAAEANRTPVNSACPDSREAALHRYWPPYVVAAFCSAEVINTPVDLYSDLCKDVTPARPMYPR